MARHPHLSKARNLTQQAISELGEAAVGTKSEFGGHRDKAEQYLRKAIEEMRLGAEYSNAHLKNK